LGVCREIYGGTAEFRLVSIRAKEFKRSHFSKNDASCCATDPEEFPAGKCLIKNQYHRCSDIRGEVITCKWGKKFELVV
jgi:hypothetical protein